MSVLMEKILSLFFLILLGYILRRKQYFTDAEIQKLAGFIGDFLIPCVIFNTILGLKLSEEHLMLSLAFFGYLAILLLSSWLLYKLLRIKRKFFIFFNCMFAFGLMGIPLFSTVFGEENMEYLVAMGVGHELFFALVYVTAAKIVFAGEKPNRKTLLHNLTSPLFLMVLAALVLNLTGWGELLKSSMLGSGILSVIGQLGSITMVLTMLVVGYRLHFQDKSHLRESAFYVLVRYVLTFALGYLIKALVLDRLAGSSVYFDYAFFTMLSQFGSTLLVVLVGKYCSQEDMEICSNALVLNTIVGIVLYLLFVLRLSIVL